MLAPKYIAIVFIMFLFTTQSYSQDGIFHKFKSISGPEKRWAIAHPFIVKKSLRLSTRALEIAKMMQSDPELDGDPSGGQIDAFRHAYWMLLLCETIGEKKARKLGLAHEKGNFRDYRKHRLEEGILPDSVSCEMDLRNNEVGINLALEGNHGDEKSTILSVKKAIMDGKLWKIRKNANGQFIDCEGNILTEEDYKGKWLNSKCLVESDK